MRTGKPRSGSVSKIQKRDGRVVDFNPAKISRAITKAFDAVKEKNGGRARRLTGEVMELVRSRIKGTPRVEDVQDLVEEVLIKHGHAKAAKAYILYRRKRAELREVKEFFGVVDDLKLGINAIKVLERRYLLRDDNFNVIETPSGMFRRVANTIATVDKKYCPECDTGKVKEGFYTTMAKLEFLPNSPTLMNAGTGVGQLSACFVLPIEDSVESIFDALKYMALIHQSGGGTGFSFSRIRPRGDVVQSTMGVASGPISFMRAFDMATEIIKQGGRRRGANMGILRVDHPDILEFIPAKSDEGLLSNFNVSVAVTDAFMEAVKKDEEYPLINPRNGEVVKRLRALDVFEFIVVSAWRTGDPGLIFIDEINRHNPTPMLGEIESTNPCAEQPLLPYESCNLGSINLAKMIMREGDDAQVDYERLGRTVKTAVHFLDNVIDANKFPLKQIEKMTKGNRKIGLGVMGFAYALLELGIPYNSGEALKKAEEIMGFITRTAREASADLARERGVFPNYDGSIWDDRGIEVRNASVTTIAPTGTLSIISSTSSSIEPIFAVSFYRSVMEGSRLLEINPVFERIARERGFYSRSLLRRIARVGSVQGIKEVPEDVRRTFVTSMEIPPEMHVRMQAAFQRHVDSAVSKTVNLPSDASLEDVKKIFLLAHELKCKGITVYRYGSKPKQVLYIGSASKVQGGATGRSCTGVSSGEKCPL
jgi:ribonucleoside-diphosphate reductase alpha chain